MIWLWVVFAVLFSIIAVAVTFVIMIIGYKPFKLREAVEPNQPEVLNFLPQFTDGYSKGLETSCIQLKNGDYKCSFYPTDQEQKIHSENAPVKIKTLIVGRGYRKILDKGELSSRRTQVIYIPKNPQDLPESLQKTDFGEALTSHSIVQRVMNDVNKAQIESGKAEAYIMQNYGLVAMPKEQLKKLEDIKRAEDRLSGTEKKETKETKEKPVQKPS